MTDAGSGRTACSHDRDASRATSPLHRGQTGAPRLRAQRFVNHDGCILAVASAPGPGETRPQPRRAAHQAWIQQPRHRLVRCFQSAEQQDMLLQTAGAGEKRAPAARLQQTSEPNELDQGGCGEAGGGDVIAIWWPWEGDVVLKTKPELRTDASHPQFSPSEKPGVAASGTPPLSAASWLGASGVAASGTPPASAAG